MIRHAAIVDPAASLALDFRASVVASITSGFFYILVSRIVRTGAILSPAQRCMKLNPYLEFDGRCRDAFEFYEKTLGGQIVFLQTIGESPMAATTPAAALDRVMHVTLRIGDQVLQGSDAQPGQFTTPAGFSVALQFDDVAECESVFSALAENGKVQLPFQATFWARGFGMVIDQFGTPWIVNAGQASGADA